jgi:hypothetical protein
MSNRNFDSSAITQRLGAKATARSLYTRMTAPGGANIAGNPINGNYNWSVIPEAKEGAQKSFQNTNNDLCPESVYDKGATCDLPNQ